MNNFLNYGAIPLLLLTSAFFSATEIALSSVNTARIKPKNGEKTPLAKRLAYKLATQFESSLGAILIGNNLANSAASAIATVIVISLLGEGYAWVATAVMTLLVLTFGEIIPKVLAKRFADKFSVAIAIPMYALSIIFKPVTWLFMLFVKLLSKLWSKSIADTDAVSQDDLENILDIAEDEGVLDEDSCDLLQNALDFDSVLAYEVITPRVDMEALDIGDPYEVNIKKILESTYSRLPVYQDTPDNIIGILHLNRFYKKLKSIYASCFCLLHLFIKQCLCLMFSKKCVKQRSIWLWFWTNTAELWVFLQWKMFLSSWSARYGMKQTILTGNSSVSTIPISKQTAICEFMTFLMNLI